MNMLSSFHLVVWLFVSFTLLSQVDNRGINQPWKTNMERHQVNLNEFKVLLARDGIPPIDQPVFWNTTEALNALYKHEPVIAIILNNEAKAYPLSILIYHEITNDLVGGQAVSVTYCPLCNAAIVFDRNVSFDGRKLLLDFGVSGMLRNSDMIMWDRQTESWWQQFTGEALVGDLTGAQLKIVPSMMISLETFAASYPEGKVLSTRTGHFRDYGSNPYVRYDDIENHLPYLFDGEVDTRLPSMERVINVYLPEVNLVYPMSIIRKINVLNDDPEGHPLVIFYQSKTVSVLDKSAIDESKQVGSVTVFSRQLSGNELSFRIDGSTIKDNQTNSSWNIVGYCYNGELKGTRLKPIAHGNHFAFAWFAFSPESKIYSIK